MRASLLLSLLALSSTASAQFTSGFENWTDTVPTDWMGVKTNMSADSVEQVSANPHSGTYAVRLRNSPTATKRFTTDPLHVDSAQAYEVTYWVRGQGEIRAAMFDGRTENFGYSPNTAYVIVNSTAWAEQTSTLICDHTNDAGEFILYVRSTGGPDRIVVDDVNITLGIVTPPVEASIYEIQYTTAPDGNSPFMDQAVITGGIVTGVDTIDGNSYFIQSGTGPWNGIYAFDATSVVAIGDSVTLTATVTEFNTTTELTSVTNLMVVGQYPTPAPVVVDPGEAAAEQWEGVLVRIPDLECMNLPILATFNEWTGTNWLGSMPVDDLMYLSTPTVGTFYSVTGVMHYANGARKIEPRDLNDIEIGNGIGEFAGGSVTVFPNPVTTSLTLDIPSINGRTVYTLTDAIGRTVLNAVITAERSTIDVSAMPAGIYALTLRNGGSTWSTRVVVR